MNDKEKMEDHLTALRAKLELPVRTRLNPEGLLGSGGMAEVKAVFDDALMRHIACKTIHKELLDSDDVMKEFVREVRITAALEHPFIVPVYQLGFNETGQLFFTMKRIAGTNLENYISELEPGRLNRKTLVGLLEVLVKVCDALSFAHDRGVVHCDLKPEHIVMSDYGEVYVMDWGVAHIMPDAHPSLATLLEEEGGIGEEEEAVVKGTIQYMSPEQATARWDQVTPRSDVFSIGAILYEILARVPPYLAPSPMEQLELAMRGDYPPLAEEIEPGSVPPELECLVTKAMAVDPQERYPSARALGEALRAFMGGGGEFPTIRYEAGEHILEDGEEADCAYIIKSGRCEAYREVGGKRVSLEVMEEGTVFGELALLTDHIRSAGVVALAGGVEVHRIKAADFESEMDHLRPWVRHIVEMLAERVRKHDNDR